MQDLIGGVGAVRSITTTTGSWEARDFPMPALSPESHQA
jgi:hypothetical protein